MMNTVLIGLSLMAPNAIAGNCDHYVTGAANAQGEDLVQLFSSLTRCDRQIAEDNFVQFMTSTDDTETLISLSLTAIDEEIWSPVWLMLGKITSYDARDEVATQIGATCNERAPVVNFLQGAYFGLRDIDFRQWDDAFIACDSDVLEGWLSQQMESPPQKMFDDKFDALMDIYVAKFGVSALPQLATGAIAAAENGPYSSILTKMDSAVAPELGGMMSPENQQALEVALVQIASDVSPEKARDVADRLAASGSEDTAASLLPVIYSDRMRGDGGFLYGAVAFELGDCKGENSAILHIAEVEENGSRWIIQNEVEPLMRAMRPRLTKCEPAEGEWAVATTTEPISSGADIDAWASELEAQWTAKGYTVTVRNEKTIALP